MSKIIKLNSATVRIESGAVKRFTGFCVADRRLKRLYPQMFDKHAHFIKAGEEAKSLDRVQKLLSEMAAHEFHRDDTLAVIGGGSIGDLAGFAASIYMRGIDWRFMPTTLLAMVDSCIGGKTAVNIDKMKNIAGSFHQANEVTIDPLFLQSLPDDEYLSGLGEIIKTALLFDKELYSQLVSEHEAVKNRDNDMLSDIIYRVCKAKAAIVDVDLREHGQRTLLNLGHTAGHMIESESSFAIPHGKAVATGIYIEAQFGQELGLVSQDVVNAIREIMELYGFDTAYNAKKKLRHILHLDKKQSQNGLKMPFITEIGQAEIKALFSAEAERLLLLLHE